MRGKDKALGFLGGSVVKNPSASAGETGLIPDLGRSHMPWSHWAHTLEPNCSMVLYNSLCSRAHVLQLLKPVSPRAHALQQGKPLQ